MEKKRDRLGLIALKKARQLDQLINELQNTTIGSLNEDVNANTLNINNIYNTLTFMQNQIAAISNILGATYNPDGTLLNETYSAHTHSYTDDTISDTTDGSGIVQTTNKTTSAVDT